MIFVDYFLVMTLLCSAVVLYHNYFEMKPPLCCACCCGADGCDRLCLFGEGLMTTTQKAGSGGAAEEKKGAVTRFFEDRFPFALIKNPVSRGLFLVLVAPAGYLCSKIKVADSSNQILPPDHPFQRFFDMQDVFRSTDEDRLERVSIVWGLHPDALDLTGVNLLWDKDATGTVIADDEFAFSAELQEHMVSTCDVLRGSGYVVQGSSAAAGTTKPMVFCWIEHWRDWLSANGTTFPISDVVTANAALKQWYAASPWVGPEFSRAMAKETDIMWHSSTEEANGTPEVKLVRIESDSTMRYYGSTSPSVLHTEYDNWQGLVAQINSACPDDTCKKAIQCVGERTGINNKWVFKDMQDMYFRIAMSGLGIGVGVAAAVLLVSICNVFVVVVAICAIIGAIVCVMACIQLIGFSLGNSECQFVMILSGFAVDYVVHLAHAYVESQSAARLERAHDAIKALGASVFWGMATSVFACIALCACQLQYFMKFGVFFLLTIVWGYLWAVLFMMPVLAQFGPQMAKGSPPSTLSNLQTA